MAEKQKQVDEKQKQTDEACKQADEAAKKEADEKAKQADAGKPAPDASKPTADAAPAGEHPDEQHDIALIKKYLDEYLGADNVGEAEMTVAKKAHAFRVGKGEKPEDAAKTAAGYTEFAKAMANETQETDESDQGTDLAAKGATSADATKVGAAESDEAKKEAEEKKKEADKKLAELVGENAKLKEQIKKVELEKHVETILRESHLPMSATKDFRKIIENCKTKEDVDAQFVSFKEGFKGAGGEVNPFIVTRNEKGANTSGGVSFGNCVK